MESQTAHTHIIAADGSADIVINCGADLFDLDGRRLSKRGDSLLCTISKGHTYVQSNGGLRIFGIRLRASELPHFCGASMKGLASQYIATEDIFGDTFGAHLREAAFFENAYDIATLVDRELTSYATKLRRSRVTAFDIAPLLTSIHRNNGNLTLGALVKLTKTSERTLHRAFTAHLGMGAKRYASIVRFNHALCRIAHYDNLSSFAQDCGYFDHAHLVHDFRRYGGITPSNHPLLSDFYKT